MEKFRQEYEIVKRLGRGSFARVVLARNITTGALYAVKVFDKKDDSNPLNPLNEPPYVIERRALEEISLSPHAGLAQLHATFEDETHVLFVMTYAQGGDMLSWLEKRHTQEASGLPRVSEQEIKVIFHQILSAVNHFHELGLCHRDVKLENILLDSYCSPILIDFNLSCKWSHNQTLKTHCGSLYYTPPEMFERQNYVGPEVDVWSLGVVLYSMMFKRFPFMATEGTTTSETNLSIARNIIKCSYPLPNATRLYSMDALSLLTSLLVKDRQARPTCASLLFHPWFMGINRPESQVKSITSRLSTRPPKYDDHYFSCIANYNGDEVGVKEIKKEVKDDHSKKASGKKGGAESKKKLSIEQKMTILKFLFKSFSKKVMP